MQLPTFCHLLNSSRHCHNHFEEWPFSCCAIFCRYLLGVCCIRRSLLLLHTHCLLCHVVLGWWVTWIASEEIFKRSNDYISPKRDESVMCRQMTIPICKSTGLREYREKQKMEALRNMKTQSTCKLGIREWVFNRQRLNIVRLATTRQKQFK